MASRLHDTTRWFLVSRHASNIAELDSRGEASILVPPVRITQIRSRSRNSPWYQAAGAIEVIGREDQQGQAVPEGLVKTFWTNPLRPGAAQFGTVSCSALSR